MIIFRLMLTVALAIAAGYLVDTAQADEAYLCDGGRIVYVKMGQLERMKREDPCIAQYYGLTAAPAAAEAKSVLKPSAADQAQPTAPGGMVAMRVLNATESGRWFKPR